MREIESMLRFQSVHKTLSRETSHPRSFKEEATIATIKELDMSSTTKEGATGSLTDTAEDQPQPTRVSETNETEPSTFNCSDGETQTPSGAGGDWLLLYYSCVAMYNLHEFIDSCMLFLTSCQPCSVMLLRIEGKWVQHPLLIL
jgi:hypothetical protein